MNTKEDPPTTGGSSFVYGDWDAFQKAMTENGSGNSAKGNRPYKGESGKEFAKRLMDEKYGVGNYKTGPSSEYNKIRKWGDRGFE